MEMFNFLKEQLVRLWRQSKLFRYGSLLSVFLAAALVVILPALSQPVTLTFLTLAPDLAPLKPVIQDFERQNPGIKINVIEGPNASNQVEDLNTTAFLLGNSPYDLVNLDIVWLPKFAAAGWLTDLSDRFPKEARTDFLEGNLNGNTYEDKLYAIPWRTDAGMLYYRKDLLEQIGAKPPETFSELMQISKTLKQDKAADWGFVWQGRQYEGTITAFIEVLEGNGGFWINPDTKEVGLDRPEAIEAVKFLLSTVQQGVSPPGVSTYIEEDTRRLFQAGKTVFMRNWPYAYPLLNAEDSPVKGKVGIKPMVHAPNQESAAALGGWSWGISSSTPHPEEAWKMVQFFTSPESQRKYILESGWLPSRKSLYKNPEILAKFPHFSQIASVLETSALRPPIGQYAQASDILQRYLSATITGRISPEDAMKSAANETRQLLKA